MLNFLCTKCLSLTHCMNHETAIVYEQYMHYIYSPWATEGWNLVRTLIAGFPSYIVYNGIG